MTRRSSNLINWVWSVSEREWRTSKYWVEKDHDLRTERKLLWLELTEHEGLCLRVRQGLYPVGVWYTYLLLSKPVWVFWIRIPTFHSVDLKTDAFHIELSPQYSLGLSPSIKVPGIIRGISTCILFHTSICQVKMCQAPCCFESGVEKLK